MNLKSHRAKPKRNHSRAGFTLIEFIATVLVSAIMVALMLPLIGSGLQGNRRPLLRMPATYNLRTEMDDWWQQYRAFSPNDLSGLATAITTADPPSYTLTWVEFDTAGVESDAAAGVEDVLRFTLANAQGERLTAYFFPIP